MTPADFKQHRLALGLSQADLAEVWGIDKGTISRWERGEVPVHPLAARLIQYEAGEVPE